MAIYRPKTIGDAPACGLKRSGGRRRETFLPREEWALAQGKKVLSDGVAAQAIEAQPVFGQIKPSRRSGASRALNNNLRRRRGESRLRQRSRNVSAQRTKRCAGNGGIVPEQNRSSQRERVQPPSLCGPSGNQRGMVDRFEDGRDYLLLKLDDPSFNVPMIRAYSTTTMSKRLSLTRRCRENWMRCTLQHPARLQWVGPPRPVKRIHAVPPMKPAPTQAKNSCQASEGTAR
jgi:hypothetical protein